MDMYKIIFYLSRNMRAPMFYFHTQFIDITKNIFCGYLWHKKINWLQKKSQKRKTKIVKAKSLENISPMFAKLRARGLLQPT